MSQTVFKPTDNQKLKLDTLAGCQTCVCDAVLRRLGEVWASGLNTTRGDLRNIINICFMHDSDDEDVRREYKLWKAYVPDELAGKIGAMLLSAGPYLSTEGNIEEFKINDPSMLEDCDENVIGSSQGPVLVRFEMDMDDGVYGSDMRTFLWSGRTESMTLGNHLRAAWDALCSALIAGTAIADIDRDGIIAAALGAESEGGHTVEEVKIVRLYGVSNAGLTDSSTHGEIFRDNLEVGQVLGVRMDIEIVLGGGDCYLLGAEKTLLIGMTGAAGFGKGTDTAPCLMIPSVRPFDEAPLLYGLAYIRPGATVNVCYYEEAPKKSKETLIRRTEEMLERWGSIAGLSKGMMAVMFFGKTDQWPALELLLRIMHGQIASDHKILLTTARFKAFVNTHTKYAYNSANVKKFKATYNKVQFRSGNWHEAIDGPAMDQARDVLGRLIGVSSREIALMATDGPGTIMPATYNDPQHGLMQVRTKSGIQICLRLLFLLYSGRRLPWTEKKYDTTDAVVRNWVKDHLRDPTAGKQSQEVVSWQLYSWRERGKAWLNHCALKQSLVQYNIGPNDWQMWLKISNESLGNPSSHSVFRVLLLDLPANFPYFITQGRTKRVSAIRNLIGKLAADEIKERTGKQNYNDRYWSREEICIIALTHFLNGEKPRDPHRENDYHKVGFLQELTYHLPHRTQYELNSALTRKNVQIANAYREVCRQIVDHGFDILKPYISGDAESVIQVFLDEGLMDLAEQYADTGYVAVRAADDADSEEDWLLGQGE